MGEATTFGDDWLQRETRGKREYEIALLPTGSQAVPQQSHFIGCILEGLKQAHAKTLNYSRLADIE